MTTLIDFKKNLMRCWDITSSIIISKDIPNISEVVSLLDGKAIVQDQSIPIEIETERDFVYQLKEHVEQNIAYLNSISDQSELSLLYQTILNCIQTLISYIRFYSEFNSVIGSFLVDRFDDNNIKNILKNIYFNLGSIDLVKSIVAYKDSSNKKMVQDLSYYLKRNNIDINQCDYRDCSLNYFADMFVKLKSTSDLNVSKLQESIQKSSQLELELQSFKATNFLLGQSSNDFLLCSQKLKDRDQIVESIKRAIFHFYASENIKPDPSSTQNDVLIQLNDLLMIIKAREKGFEKSTIEMLNSLKSLYSVVVNSDITGLTDYSEMIYALKNNFSKLGDTLLHNERIIKQYRQVIFTINDFILSGGQTNLELSDTELKDIDRDFKSKIENILVNLKDAYQKVFVPDHQNDIVPLKDHDESSHLLQAETPVDLDLLCSDRVNNILKKMENMSIENDIMIQKKNTEIDGLGDKLNKTLKELSLQKSQFTKLEKETKTARDEYDKSITELNEKNRLHLDKLTRDNNKTIKKNKSECDDSLSNLQSSQDSIQKQLQESNALVSKFKKEKSVLEKDKNDLISENNILSESNNSLEKQLLKFSQKCDKLMEENSLLTDKNIHLEKKDKDLDYISKLIAEDSEMWITIIKEYQTKEIVRRLIDGLSETIKDNSIDDIK